MISDQILHPSGVPDAPPPEPTLAPVAPTAEPILAAPEPAAVVVEHIEPVVITPQETVTITPVPEIPIPLAEPAAEAGMLQTAWNGTAYAARLLNGLRTLLFFGVTGSLAVLAKLADVDLSGTISRLVGGKVDATDITIFMSLFGMVLRFLTKTQVFARWRKAAQGDKLSEASAAVDDPEDESN